MNVGKAVKKANKKQAAQLTYGDKQRPVKIVVDQYKGRPYLHFYDEQGFEMADADDSQALARANILTFGVAKAKLIVEAIEEIKAFIAENEESEG